MNKQFYKIIPISEEEYITNRTDDGFPYDMCEQENYCEDGVIYVAVESDIDMVIDSCIRG